MKNTIKIIGIIAMVAVIGFSMAACADDSSGDEGFATDGRLTITGLNDYNGQFVSAQCNDSYYDVCTHTDDGFILAAKDASIYSLGSDKWPTYNLAKISGGAVTLKVFKYENEELSYKNFTENGEIKFLVEIAPTEDDFSDIVGTVTVTVTFTNGVGTGAFVAD